MIFEMTLSAFLFMVARATLNTLWIGLAAFLLASFLGLLLGIACRAEIVFIRIVIQALMVGLRGIPLLVILFLSYFSLHYAGLPVSPQVTAVLGIALYLGVQIGEVVSAAIRTVPIGQVEAGLSLGYDPLTVRMEIVFPQAVRAAWPSYVNLLPITLRATALASVIGAQELTSAARELSAVSSSLTIWVLVVAIYFVLTYPLVRLGNAMQPSVTSVSS